MSRVHIWRVVNSSIVACSEPLRWDSTCRGCRFFSFSFNHLSCSRCAGPRRFEPAFGKQMDRRQTDGRKDTAQFMRTKQANPGYQEIIPKRPKTPFPGQNPDRIPHSMSSSSATTALASKSLGSSSFPFLFLFSMNASSIFFISASQFALVSASYVQQKGQLNAVENTQGEALRTWAL